MTLKKQFIPEPLPRFKACFACKARKVRCDGVHPICGTCAKRERGEKDHLTPCEWSEEKGDHHHSPGSTGSNGSGRVKRKRPNNSSKSIKKENGESDDHSDFHSNASHDNDISSEPIFAFPDPNIQNQALQNFVSNYEGYPPFQFPLGHVSESPTGIPTSNWVHNVMPISVPENSSSQWGTSAAMSERMERMEYRMVNLENILATQNRTIHELNSVLRALQKENQLRSQNHPSPTASSDDHSTRSSSNASLLSQPSYPYITTSMAPLSAAPMLSTPSPIRSHLSTASPQQFSLINGQSTLSANANGLGYGDAASLELLGLMSVSNGHELLDLSGHPYPN
ncbi:hypothetical protein BT69DRAFT_446956 [Atractiella rhizophila]|nr:hypothetical protein BT69DRAFT_1352712 [Atractiella rhizophila]KAH8920013.1 hypothetical protein BT69DRAFT_446956 [Atractiella rhizophila]